MAYIPQDAIDIFASGVTDPVQVVYNKGILNFLGKPASRRTVERWYTDWKHDPDQPKASTDYTADDDEYSAEEIPPRETNNPDGSKQVSSQSSLIKSVDDLLRVCKIDLALWEITSAKVRPYQGYRRDEKKNLSFKKGKMTGTILDEGEMTVIQMFSITVSLIPRRTIPFEETITRLIDRMYEGPKIFSVVKTYPQANHLFMPAAFDVHIGRRDLTNTYTPDRAAKEFVATHDVLLNRVSGMGMKVERILFPVAGDVLNADTMSGTTTRGTLQDMSADARDAAFAASECHITAIEHALEVAPVDVVLVKGNHDEYGLFWLSLVIRAFFANHRYRDYITVDVDRKPRKYYQYGSNLIGLEHGDKVKEDKLAGMMALEAPPEMWSTTVHRMFFRGHFHRTREVYVRISDQLGVEVTTIPTFAPPDEWELQMGYIGNKRRAEGRLFHKTNGPAGMFPVFVEEINAQ